MRVAQDFGDPKMWTAAAMHARRAQMMRTMYDAFPCKDVNEWAAIIKDRSMLSPETWTLPPSHATRRAMEECTLTALYADNALQATVEPAKEPITVEDATGGSSPSQGVGALDLLASAATNGAPRRSRVQQTARPRKAQASGLRRTTQRHKAQASGLRKTARRRKPILNRFDPAHGV